MYPVVHDLITVYLVHKVHSGGKPAAEARVAFQKALKIEDEEEQELR